MLARYLPLLQCYGNIMGRTTIIARPLLASNFSTNRTTSQDANASAQSEGRREEQDSSSKEDDVKFKIFNAALPLVHQLGWTKECLEAGAESIGLSKSSHGIFEHGGTSFVHFFHRNCNKELRKIAKDEQIESAKSDELTKVHQLLEQRLQMILPYLPQWPQAMALMARPHSSLDSYKLLYELADDICFFAGDRSLNATWYTKRAAVAGLYITGELSLVQDKSANCDESWRMLARRIDDLRKVEEFGGSCSRQQEILKDIAQSSLTLIRNLTGMQSYQRNSR
ncbi:ubiquinone biosynthesis protein COQ9, mitochondrial [Cloeon dipterum]|uniref:ubiquinone biosynthesis protein COQ9, mitochondrial n=1 Tax=Cloeon dipterum TaxID=197152 RepID=UPI00322060E8